MANTLNFVRSKKSEILEVAAKYNVTNIRVFGSVVRGEDKEDSDVDLLVHITNYDGMGFGFVKFEHEISKVLNKKAHIISDRAVNKHLKEIIFSEAIPL